MSDKKTEQLYHKALNAVRTGKGKNVKLIHGVKAGKYSVEAGRAIYENGVPLIGFIKEGNTSPTEADKITRKIGRILNENSRRRKGAKVQSSGTYSVAAGRQIYRNGRPFISVMKLGSTSPTVADDLTREIAFLLNKDLGARVQRAFTPGVHGMKKSNRRTMLGEHDDDILEGMARGVFADQWAMRQEERGRSFSGMDIYDEAPRTPLKAAKWAKQLREKILNMNEAPSLTYLYEIAQSKGYKNDPERFGFHLGMQAVGHGVGWQDDADYRRAKDSDIKLPHDEFYL